MQLPSTWTIIAESRFTGLDEHGRSKWISTDDAVVSVDEARDMFDRGLILMAQRREKNGLMALLIKARDNG